MALLNDQPTDDAIDLEYLAGVCASDWGLWKTTKLVADRAWVFAAQWEKFAGPFAAAVERFHASLDEVPKTRTWKMRARIGERKRWYEVPEEV